MSFKTERTKEHIQSIFFRWMDEVGIDKMTVAGIAKRANINRGTFYLYFTDKYAVLQEVEDAIYQEMNTSFSTYFQEKFTYVKQGSLTDFSKRFYDTSYYFACFFYEKKELFSILLGKNGDPYFVRKIEQLYIQSVQKEHHYSSEEISDYHITFIFAGIISVLENWLISGTKETPQEITSILKTCVLKEPIAHIYDYIIDYD